jgi:hypothetical protein
MRHFRHYWTGGLAGICLVALIARPAAAADDGSSAVERFERTAEQIRRETFAQVVRDVPPGQRAFVDYGAYLTLSYLSFDDRQNDNHAYRGGDLVGYARVNFDNAHEFYIRGRLTYRDFNPGDGFENQPDHLEGHVEEAYYQFDLAGYLGAGRGGPVGGDNATVRIGRQFETWADGLVLSQYVDGARVVFDRGPLSLELLASVTAQDLTVDFDATRPGFHNDTRRAFYGALLSARVGAQRPFVYAMVQRDQNSDGPFDVGPIPARFRYNSYYLGAGVNGAITDKLAYGAEVVYEGGHTLSGGYDPGTLRPEAQDEGRISAYAGELHLDYLLNDRRRTRLGAGLLFASGDPDRGDTSNTFGGNRAGTGDQAFNALGLVQTGLAFAPNFSNLVVVRGVASTYPLAGVAAFSQLQVGVEVFAFDKLRSHGAIDEPTTDSRYLGWEPDLFVNWQVTDDVTLVMRYGIFFPGSAVPSDEQRQFFYAGLTYAF